MTSPTADDGKWIRRFHQSIGNSARLVCFPHAGGSATYYFPLSQALAPSIEVLALQYPGRQDRRQEGCIDNISNLAEQIYKTLLPWSTRPFAFFGHSMGAVLSFEVARLFQQRAQTGPVRLFVSGRRAPSRHRTENIHLRDDNGILAELRRIGGTDPRFLADPEMQKIILPTVRNDYKVIEEYIYAPGPPLHCPITALVGDSDPQTSIEDAAAWKLHSTGGFNLIAFPGGHFYLEAFLDDVVDAIFAFLSAGPKSTRTERDNR